MRRSKYSLVLSFLCFLAILTVTGCSLGGKVQAPNEYTRVQAAEIEEPAEDVEIEFWTYNDGWKAPINHFQLIHPKIKIKLVKFDFNDMGNVYKKALAAGEGPDILFFDSAYYSQFTRENILKICSKSLIMQEGTKKIFRRIYGKAINHLTESVFWQ